MFKLLYADCRKLLYHAGMREGLAAISGYLLVYTVVMKLVSRFVGSDITADEVHMTYSGIANLLVTACMLMTTVSDFSDGCIRNKLISGADRTAIFLSAEITGLIQAAILSAVACAESLLLSLIFTKGGMQTMTAAELADHWMINALSCMSIAVFSTMLIMVLGGSKLSYIVGIVIAVGLNIFTLMVLDKLYPEQGSCTLTGMKLTLYRFYDSFVPYAYLSMRQHHGMGSYLIGSLGLILISTVAGLLIFNKKEIQ